MTVHSKKRIRPGVTDADDSATLRLQMWFETQDGVLFGLGRLLLLRQIAESGSLKAASEKLGMSYRAAWGKLKATEKIMGVSLTEKHSGHQPGFRLSEAGESLCRKYQELLNEVESFALDRAEELMHFELQGYEEPRSS